MLGKLGSVIPIGGGNPRSGIDGDGNPGNDGGVKSIPSGIDRLGEPGMLGKLGNVIPIGGGNPRSGIDGIGDLTENWKMILPFDFPVKVVTCVATTLVSQ